MKRTCNACGKTFDDFDHSTVCPHEWFPVSDSALKLLVEDGTMCPRCEEHVDNCNCKPGERADG